MSKFRVIEESRFLKTGEMSGVMGGVTCDRGHPYTNCHPGGLWFVSCGPSVASFQATSELLICSEDMSFKSTNCAGRASYSIHCRGDEQYG